MVGSCTDDMLPGVLLRMFGLFPILLLCANLAASITPPTIDPEKDNLVPTHSSQNITYMCSTDEDVVGVFWDVEGKQVSSEDLKNQYRDAGIIIEDENQGKRSTVIVTMEGRRTLGRDSMSLSCYSYRHNDTFHLSWSKRSSIIQFDIPAPPEDLRLIYLSQEQAMLQWKRPANIVQAVEVIYLIEIANLTSGSVTQMYGTKADHFMINQTAEGRCQPHSFTVTARNEAGDSNSTSIQESIPISPDIIPISESLKVEQVTFQNSFVLLSISFEPATNCSTQFPVLNYTVSIEGLEGSLTVDGGSGSDRTLTVALSSTDFPQLAQGQQYSITITACTNFTCRSPDDPLLAFTTDVQRASAVFYDTTVSLNCSFAAGSSARACLFVFTLTNEDRQENITISQHEGNYSLFIANCSLMNNTLAAYDGTILVYGVNSNGTIDGQPLKINGTIVTEVLCQLQQSEGGGDGSKSKDWIIGLEAASAFVVFSILVLIIIFLSLRIKKIKKEYEVPSQEDGIKSWFNYVLKVGKALVMGISDDSLEEETTLTAEKIEIEDFPVAAIEISKESKSIVLRPICSKEVKDWKESWCNESKVTIHLYPRKRPQKHT